MAGLIAALFVRWARVARARTAVLHSSVELDSVETARDMTAEVEVATLDDSVRIFVKRVQQQVRRADEFDWTLNPSLLAGLNAQVRAAALDSSVRTDTVLRRLNGEALANAPH